MFCPFLSIFVHVHLPKIWVSWTKMDNNGQKWTLCSNIVLFAWKCVETDFKLKNFENNFLKFFGQSDFWDIEKFHITQKKCIVLLAWKCVETWNTFKTKNNCFVHFCPFLYCMYNVHLPKNWVSWTKMELDPLPPLLSSLYLWIPRTYGMFLCPKNVLALVGFVRLP